MPINERATTTTAALLPHVDRHLAAGAFVCHALEHRERSDFEGHLEQCRSCRSEVRSFHTLLADVAVDSPVSEVPPAALRDAVMSSIRLVRQVSPLVPPRPTRA